MVFSSSIFLLYFLPAFLLIYFLADKKYKNLVAFLASLFFYAWGAPKFIFIVLLSLFIDFFLVKRMDRSQHGTRRALLCVSLLMNLGLLLYFKYANFFIENYNSFLNSLGHSSLTWTDILLPIGISFFTFQKLSYLIDVYRKVHKPLNNIVDYMLYILLFPHSIAGPIIRFNEIADQIEERSSLDTIDNKLLGLYRFIIGLAKKVLIANVLGEQADKIFAMNEGDVNTPLAWLGIIAYTFQIYFDFSGYSDMAIGIGRMMGFIIPENFNYPYISRNITEFWQRWHITLGKWFRDYLYIPLGGNRVSQPKLYFNLWFVFLISGLWHGSGWNFIFWGAYHGFFLILDRLFLIKLLNKIGKFPSIAFNFIIVTIGWVFFRSDSFGFALRYLKKMFAFDLRPVDYVWDIKFVTILVLAFIFSLWGGSKMISKLESNILYEKHGALKTTFMTAASVALFMICVGAITASNFNPFIYFRF